MRIENVKVQLEKLEVPMMAKFEETNPIEQQEIDDKEMLKEVGDSRTMVQKGKIHSPDGETVIETDLQFIRTRNKNGGIDVLCVVPSLGLTPTGG